MGSDRLFVVLISILGIVLPNVIDAKVFMVGDGSGWTINFDYKGWAAGKDFRVGDQIVFRYPLGKHNVYKVNGTDFQSCSVPLDSVPLTTGNDVITLATPGRKWYICGVAQHCAAAGQKLFITVQPSLVLTPVAAPAPWTSWWSFPIMAPTEASRDTSKAEAPAPSAWWWPAPSMAPTTVSADLAAAPAPSTWWWPAPSMAPIMASADEGNNAPAPSTWWWPVPSMAPTMASADEGNNAPAPSTWWWHVPSMAPTMASADEGNNAPAPSTSWWWF